MEPNLIVGECPTEKELERYLLGDLKKERLNQIDVHLEQCADCESSILALEKDIDFGFGLFPRNSSNKRTELEAFNRHSLVSRLIDIGSEETLEDAATNSDTTSKSQIAIAGREIGDYELLEEVGRGGMGVVYKARQKSLNRIVALKTILSAESAQAEEIDRFVTEAEAVAKLSHPGIVSIFEVGRQGNCHFYSMSYIEGTTLGDLIVDQPLRSFHAAKLLSQIADAISYSHALGIVHRDLKPGNILIDLNGSPIVTDFGLVKRMDLDSNLTGTGRIMGTPSYMAPEQAAGRNDEVGPAADTYALGAILYALLTGRPPFQAATVHEALSAVVDQEPVSPRRINPNIEGDLNTICLKCLRKEIHNRYESVDQLADDLRRFLEHRPIVARPVSIAERARKWTIRNPMVATLSAISTLAIVALFVGSLIYQTRLKSALSDARKSEQKRTDVLYESLIAQSKFLNQTRPVGYGRQIWKAIKQTRELKTTLANTKSLRQLAVNALGHSCFEEPHEIGNLNSALTKAEVTPDQRFAFLGFESGELVIIDLRDYVKLTNFAHHTEAIVSIRFTDPNTCITASAFCKEIHRWRFISGEWMHDTQVNVNPQPDVSDVRLGPEARYIVGWYNCQFRKISMDTWIEFPNIALATGKREFVSLCLRRFDDQGNGVHITPLLATPSFAMNRRYLIGNYSQVFGGDGTIQVYDLQEQKVVWTFVPPAEARLILIDRDSNYLACAGSGGCFIYDFKRRVLIEQISRRSCVLGQFIDSSSDLTFREGDTFIRYSVTQQKRVIELDVAGFRKTKGHWYSRQFRFDYDQRKHHVGIAPTTSKELATLHIDNPGLHDIRFSPDGKMVILGVETNDAQIWDAALRERICAFDGNRVSLHPSGKIYAEATQSFVRIRAWPSGSVLASTEFHHHLNRLRFSADGSYLVGFGWELGRFTVFRLDWKDHENLSDCTLTQVLYDGQGGSAADWHPTRNELAWVARDSSSGTYRLNIRDFDEPGQRTRQFASNLVNRLCSVQYFHPNQLSCLCDGKIQLWNPDQETHTQSSEFLSRSPACKSPDGKYVVYRHQIIDTETLEVLIELPTVNGNPWGLDWSPDGRKLAFCYTGGDAEVWDLELVRQKLDSLGLAWNKWNYRTLTPIATRDQSPAQDAPLAPRNLKMLTPTERDAKLDPVDRWTKRRLNLLGLLEETPFDEHEFVRELISLGESLSDDHPKLGELESLLISTVSGLNGDVVANAVGDDKYERLTTHYISKYRDLKKPTNTSFAAHFIMLSYYADWLSVRSSPADAILFYQRLEELTEESHAEDPRVSHFIGSRWFWAYQNMAASYYDAGEKQLGIDLMFVAREHLRRTKPDEIEASFIDGFFRRVIYWLEKAGRHDEAEEWSLELSIQ